MKWFKFSKKNFQTQPAGGTEFVLVGRRGSGFFYSVISLRYFEQLKTRAHLTPPEVYDGNEYLTFVSPFTWSALTELLPFKITANGLISTPAGALPAEDARFLKFHLECVRILQKYKLGRDRLWFEYATDDGAPYAREFRLAQENLSKAAFGDRVTHPENDAIQVEV